MTDARAALRSLIPDALRQFESAGRQTLRTCASAGFAGSQKAPSCPPLQSGEDLIDLAAAECGRLQGEATGRALRRELEERFHAQTANHLGVDFHPEFFQGDLLFAMGCRHAVPVFSCGGVPADNVAFPRGLLLSRGQPGDNFFGCEKLPVLSGRHRHQLVSLMPAFDAATVRAACAGLPGRLPDPADCAALAQLVQQLYLHPRVLAQRLFREQAGIMNGLLWQAAIQPACGLPPLATLDMQWLCSQLLRHDLQQPGTLARRLLLEPALLAAVWEELNGDRACWTGDEQALCRGTFLFWGVGEHGRGLALTPSDRFSKLTSFKHPGWSMVLTAQNIREALEQGRLVPSLFLSFAVTCLARGLRCAGGVFQAAYLPRMAQGLAAALRRCGEPALAGRVEGGAPSCQVCTGLLPLRIPRPEGSDPDAMQAGRAAGPAELWLAGGLSPALWQRLCDTAASDALAVSLPYHYDDLLGAHAGDPVRQALLREAAAAACSLPFLTARHGENCHA
ncbi:MAG TPA: hypothetical protein IAB01_06860 [Candidatus Avidesulfovibrio excrementigallinarum]|nr:hypothetical protein [Candidatus Avidesulfovibrio excrementigallinarum]